MRSPAKESLRWAGVIIPGGLAVRGIFDQIAFASRLDEGWLGKFGTVVFVAAVYSPHLAVAYICLRRQYRDLLVVLGALAALATFALLMGLPNKLHLHDSMVSLMESHPLLSIPLAPVAFAMLVVPFWAGVWVFRYFFRLARRPSAPPIAQDVTP